LCGLNLRRSRVTSNYLSSIQRLSPLSIGNDRAQVIIELGGVLFTIAFDFVNDRI
jgi:hypothetical protein